MLCVSVCTLSFSLSLCIQDLGLYIKGCPHIVGSRITAGNVLAMPAVVWLQSTV